jgi:hypothetical protein
VKTFDKIEKNDGRYTLVGVGYQFGIEQEKPQIVPGRFYSFKMISPTPALTEETVPMLTRGRRYYDLYPTGLLLFHENWQQTMLVLNLKVMPIPIAAKLLEAYYALASRNDLPTLFEDDKLRPIEQRRLLDKRFYLFPPSLIAQTIGASNLDYAINKYKMEDVFEARLIDFDQFGMLVKPKFSTLGLFPETLNMELVFEEFIEKSI